MIVYRCDRCGKRIDEDQGEPRITFRHVRTEEHFCSVPCLMAWGEWTGYYKPAADGVVDAEVMCGAQSESGSNCRFTADHPGDHVSYNGEVWDDNFALVWHLERAVQAAFDASSCGDVNDGVHYRGKAVGLQTAISIVKGDTT